MELEKCKWCNGGGDDGTGVCPDCESTGVVGGISKLEAFDKFLDEKYGDKIILTKENYHSKEANEYYWSVSQFKEGMDCQSRMMASLKGLYNKESKALIVGSYLHTAFDNKEEFEKFNEEYKDVIYNSKGKKYADFVKADLMIDTLKNDELAMFALTGEKEVIYTGELFGEKFKIRVDNINHQMGYFSDIKTTQDIYKGEWSDKYNKRVSFVEKWDYILQMFIYREIIFQNTGKYYIPYIVAISKQDVPDKAVISIKESRFDFERDYLEEGIKTLTDVKKGSKEASECLKCEWCRLNKKIKNVIEVGDLI